MSVVGPRPMILAEYDQIQARDRYGANDIRPGLTGWAQVNGRDGVTVEENGEAHALELGHLERELARRRGEAALVVAGAVSGALVGALVGPGADELVGILVERGDRLGRGLSPGMIEFGAQVVPTVCVMSFSF